MYMALEAGNAAENVEYVDCAMAKRSDKAVQMVQTRKVTASSSSLKERLGFHYQHISF